MLSRKGHAIDKKIKYDKMQLESSCRERAFYMSKIDKAKERLSLRPKDYTYSEAKYLLSRKRSIVGTPTYVAAPKSGADL